MRTSIVRALGRAANSVARSAPPIYITARLRLRASVAIGRPKGDDGEESSSGTPT
jgi:hypothetical protein